MTRPPRPRRPWSPDGVRVEPPNHRRRLDAAGTLRAGSGLALLWAVSGLVCTAIVDPMWWVYGLALINVTASAGLAARLWWITRPPR